MQRFAVVGGGGLAGEVTVTGAKNSALKLMAAALLAEGRTTLTRVPAVSDVDVMVELLRGLGCTVEHDRVAGRLQIDVPARPGHRCDHPAARSVRASMSVLGPLTARVGMADVLVPGADGDPARAVDLHADGLTRLGASLHLDDGQLIARAPFGLVGAPVTLDFPSVGATENVLMAAVLARGVTVIENAAREPEVTDLVRMLTAMGAQVEGVGSTTLVVTGVPELRPVRHEVVGDRMVAGTWVFATAIAGGDVTVRGFVAEHLGFVLERLAGAGVQLDRLPDGVRVRSAARARAFDVMTLPFPGFPTDLQPIALVFNAVAHGVAMVTENVCAARIQAADQLGRLGADVRVDGHHALVRGRPRLSAADVAGVDIRSTAALVLAGLVADGVTTVRGVRHVDRGYPSFDADLRALGADLRREPIPGGTSDQHRGR